jgi:hypothetical protein
MLPLQTGGGKTHTMEGTVHDPGVTVRAVRYLFAAAAARSTLLAGGGASGAGSGGTVDDDRSDAGDGFATRTLPASGFASGSGAGSSSGTGAYTLSLSMVEIYQERVRDLLAGVTRDDVLAALGLPHGAGGSATTASSGGRAGRRSSVSGITGTLRGGSTVSTARWVTGGGSSTGGSGSPAAVDAADLQCRETAAGVEVVGLTRVAVRSPQEALEAIRLGAINRAVGAHALNATSSRSHMIVRLWIEGPAPHAFPAGADDDGAGGGGFGLASAAPHAYTTPRRVASCLNFVDLAGSERVLRTGAQGERLKEATAINGSLSTLGSVVAGLRRASHLAAGGTAGGVHVPFRDSKLTFVLKDALCGAAKVLLLAAVSPDMADVGETVHTLNFAARCRATALGATGRNVIYPGTLSAAPVIVPGVQAGSSGGGAGGGAGAGSAQAAFSPGRGTVRPRAASASRGGAAAGDGTSVASSGSIGGGGGGGGVGAARVRRGSISSVGSGASNMGQAQRFTPAPGAGAVAASSAARTLRGGAGGGGTGAGLSNSSVRFQMR